MGACSSTATPTTNVDIKNVNFSVFGPGEAKGGSEITPAKTALVCIEYQNEFTTEGGKLHDGVKGVMASTDMLAKTVALAETVRGAGGKVFHVPIMFKADASDNPNKNLGILAGCAKDSLFTEKTWNSEFCKEMTPLEQDVVITGKKGLDAFPNTTLERELKKYGVETVVLCGFLTNCCVESTMRTACEKGFHVITVKDCCATLSEEAHKAATEGTFGMFSVPLTAAELTGKLPQVDKTPSQKEAVPAAAPAAAAPEAVAPEAAAPEAVVAAPEAAAAAPCAE